MDPKARLLFLALVWVQACHSLEEYFFQLYNVFEPARAISAWVSADLATGFAIVNGSFVVFGVWCYLARVRTGHETAVYWAWLWILVELFNGIGHPVIALSRGGYFPGLATAPFLLVLAASLAYRLALRPSSGPVAA